MTWGGFLKRIEYVNVDDKDTTNPEIINDDINFNATKSTEIKNNILQLTLRNSPEQFDGTSVFGKHVKSDFDIKFKEEDMISLFLKHTNDGNDYADSTWATSDYLVGDYMIKEIGFETSESTRITLKCVDRAYNIFNIVWSYTYGINNTFTAPGLFKHTLISNSEAVEENIKTFTGTGKNAGVSYNLSATFVSEGGYIQDYRTTGEGGPSTQLSGSLNTTATTINVDSTTGFKDSGTLVISDGTNSEHISYTGTTATSFTGCTRSIDETSALSHADNTNVYQGFPEISLSKSWKPIFEWVADISGSNYTNYTDEVTEGAVEFYGRSFIMWFDKNNAVHWIYADDTVDTTIELGEENFRAMRLEKSVFDSVNFVIYNSGEDMNGNGILYYWYDQESNVSSLKMRYQPMTEIVHNFIRDDIDNYNTTRDTTKTQDKLKQFPDSGSYPIGSWSFKSDSNSFRNIQGLSARTTLADDDAYNESLREACKYRGLQEAKSITAKTTGLRYRGDIVLKGTHLNPGDLIQVTNKYTGQLAQKIRVINVRHNVNQNGWETIAQCEEDERLV